MFFLFFLSFTKVSQQLVLITLSSTFVKMEIHAGVIKFNKLDLNLHCVVFSFFKNILFFYYIVKIIQIVNIYISLLKHINY